MYYDSNTKQQAILTKPLLAWFIIRTTKGIGMARKVISSKNHPDNNGAVTLVIMFSKTCYGFLK